MAARNRKLFVCAGEALPEKQYIILDLLYRNEPHSGIVFRFNGKVYIIDKRVSPVQADS